MADFQQVSGLWVLPVLESADDPVAIHLSIGVSSDEELTSQDVDATLTAGGQILAQTFGPNDRPLSHTSTGSVTAIADFGWSNPDHLVPESVEVRVREQSATFSLGPVEDLPVS